MAVHAHLGLLRTAAGELLKDDLDVKPNTSTCMGQKCPCETFRALTMSAAGYAGGQLSPGHGKRALL